MRHPLVYEINTRCWLRELAIREGRRVTLDNVPESEFETWRSLGFTHIWLMGVWPTGPLSRGVSLGSAHLRQVVSEILPDWTEADLAGSPFAVWDYVVPTALGGEAGLDTFRSDLHARGLKLMLDFVPNHLGLDHSWLRDRTRLFVQAEKPGEGFPVESESGVRWLAHGRDPNFPPWHDTVQLDYRLAETQAATTEVLKSIARRCDGVRCDMAMLILQEVFAETWGRCPCSSAETRREFWADAIAVIRRLHPDFLWLAEAYWDLEARLQTLGFDYTYDKRLYDYLVYRNAVEVTRHLAGVTPDYLTRSAHFLENHDEPRIASILSEAEHAAAALLTLGLPGMRLVHEGQMEGRRRRLPVQLSRRPDEPRDPAVQSRYSKLLRALNSSAVGQGDSQVLHPRPAWNGNPTWQNLAAVQWQAHPDAFDLVVVNLAAHRSQCLTSLAIPGLASHHWRMVDCLGDEEYRRIGDDLERQGLYLDLPAHGAQLFRFTPLS